MSTRWELESTGKQVARHNHEALFNFWMCLQGTTLIKALEVRRLSLKAGLVHSLGLSPGLHGKERVGGASIHHSLLPGCGRDVTSCFQLLPP